MLSKHAQPVWISDCNQNNSLLLTMWKVSKSITDSYTEGQFEDQTVSQLRSTRLVLADCRQIRTQSDYATAIHFPAAGCHMIDLSI